MSKYLITIEVESEGDLYMTQDIYESLVIANKTKVLNISKELESI